MNVGSLFSGVGGFDLGLERVGMRVMWQCEADPYRRAVLRRHWPEVPCYPDVSALRATDVAPVDVLCGGFPCTDISLAGRGAGLEGDQSRLWWEMLRCVGELRPRYVIVENVSALLARGLSAVVGSLAEIGYDAEWDCLRAADFGAPHLRNRLWIVAYPAESGLEGQGRSGLRREAGEEPASGGRASAHPEGDGRGSRRPRRPDPSGEGQLVPVGALQTLADAEGFSVGAGLREGGTRGLGGRRPGDGGGADGILADADYEGSQGHGAEHGLREDRREEQTARRGWWAVEPDVGRVADGVPSRVDRLAALGDSLVPQIAEWIGRRLMAYENPRARASE